MLVFHDGFSPRSTMSSLEKSLGCTHAASHFAASGNSGRLTIIVE